MKRLQELMAQYGACIWAVPKTVRHVYDVCNADKFPEKNGPVMYLPEHKREMFVFNTAPKHGGKFLVELAPTPLQRSNSPKRIYSLFWRN